MLTQLNSTINTLASNQKSLKDYVRMLQKAGRSPFEKFTLLGEVPNLSISEGMSRLQYTKWKITALHNLKLELQGKKYRHGGRKSLYDGAGYYTKRIDEQVSDIFEGLLLNTGP